MTLQEVLAMVDELDDAGSEYGEAVKQYLVLQHKAIMHLAMIPRVVVELDAAPDKEILDA